MRESLEIDSSEFARRGGERRGTFELAELSRLADLLVTQDGPLDWTLEGRLVKRSGGAAEAMLRLQLSAQLVMRCGRCLSAVTVPVTADRQYLLVESEEEAARRDDPESDFDILVGSRRLDLLNWIEDELMLELPSVAFHDDCGMPASEALLSQAATEGSGDGHRRPFAVLAQLKAKSSG